MAISDKWGFKAILVKIVKTFKPNLANQIALETQSFFKKNFYKEGYQKDAFVKWKERKRKYNRKVLVKTGALRASMKIKAKTFEKIEIATDPSVPYAEYHNEGTRFIPARPFLYKSKALDRKVNSIIQKEMNNLFKR